MHVPTGWPRSLHWSKEQRSQSSIWHLQVALTTHGAKSLSARLSLRAPQTGISWKLLVSSTVYLSQSNAVQPLIHSSTSQYNRSSYHPYLTAQTQNLQGSLFRRQKRKKEPPFSFIYLLVLAPTAHQLGSGTVLSGRVSNRCPSLLTLIIAQHVDHIPRSHIPAVSCAGNSRLCQNLA